MSGFVIDASVLIKTVLDEEGSAEAVALLRRGGATAPDLIVTECANILWKKTRKGELLADEAALIARVLTQAPLAIVPTRTFLENTVRLAVSLDHPAYDCAYVALAIDRGCPLVSADFRLIDKLVKATQGEPRAQGLRLAEAPGYFEGQGL